MPTSTYVLDIFRRAVFHDLLDGRAQAHHLIPQRFARLIGQNVSDMLSVALTTAEHQGFTNAWRAKIGYGKGTAGATPQQVMDAAWEIYKDYPDILHALGL